MILISSNGSKNLRISYQASKPDSLLPSFIIYKLLFFWLRSIIYIRDHLTTWTSSSLLAPSRLQVSRFLPLSYLSCSSLILLDSSGLILPIHSSLDAFHDGSKLTSASWWEPFDISHQRQQWWSHPGYLFKNCRNLFKDGLSGWRSMSEWWYEDDLWVLDRLGDFNVRSRTVNSTV